MKKMKKLISLLVSISMLLSFCIGTSMTSYAQESAPLKVTALPAFAVGSSIADANISYEPMEGLIVETKWQVYDEHREEYTKWFTVEDGVFESDKIYSLSINVVHWEETKFNGQFMYNGETYDGWYSGEGDWGCFYEFGRYSDTLEITKISVQASVPEAGAVATIDEVTLYDADGNTVDSAAVEGGVQWQAMSRGDTVDVTGETFEAEDVYFLVTDLRAKTGYSFPETMTLVVNGEESELLAEPKSVVGWKTYSLLTPLSSLEIFGLEETEAGAPIINEVESDSEEAIVNVSWLERDGSWTGDETFVAGKTYTLELDVYTGYQPLAEDFVFIVNGKSYEPIYLDAENGNARVQIAFEVPSINDGENADGTEEAPKTGDSSMLLGWSLLAAAAAASAVYVRRKTM